ncbi:hypothetical protein R50072_26560 [Simiduia litorea]|uniref:hypothetical protein n=1 Tax=Simiduia litorea TaxID=1435348 RepID=UPI0036F311C1
MPRKLVDDTSLVNHHVRTRDTRPSLSVTPNEYTKQQNASLNRTSEKNIANSHWVKNYCQY